MLDYCPKCKCKIRFYKRHECDKMKHDLADSIKLAGDVIANGDECKLKENTTHGIFRIWCVIKNIIEIICDIIKRMKCLQVRMRKLCEVQHCLESRLINMNVIIDTYNSDQLSKPSTEQADWEANKLALERDYANKLSLYNARKKAHDDRIKDYEVKLIQYNRRKAEYDRLKREYDAGQGAQQGSQGQWQDAWGTFARSGAPYDSAMGGSPNGSIHGLDLTTAHNADQGRGVFFRSLNDEGTSVEMKLNLVGYSYEGRGVAIQGGYYVQYGGTYDWYLDYYVSTDGGKTYSPVEMNVLLARHADTQNLAYGPNWQASTINWTRRMTLPAKFTHLKTEVRGDEPGERHQNVYTREQIVKKPFPPFTEQPPKKPDDNFSEKPPVPPVIPPKPEKKVDTLPQINSLCDLLDCRFDCFESSPDEDEPPLPEPPRPNPM